MRRILAFFAVACVLVVSGYGCKPAAPPAPAPWNGDIHSHPTLVCIRAHESDRGDKGGQGLHDQGYGATNGRYSGAYQFDGPTWAGAITRAGFPFLAGTPPIWDPAGGRPWIEPYFQDLGAWQLLQERGTSPWRGSGC